jgi:hypothetical protein
MRKATIAAIALLALAALATGCGRSKTYSTPSGKVTVTPGSPVTGKDKTVKVETKEGTVTVSGDQGKTITEAELGAPVYPGATVMMQGKFESKAGGQPGVQQNILVSSDSFDKVVAFYKSHLKNVSGEQNMSNGDSKMAMFTVGKDKNAMMVHINWDADKKQTMTQVMKQGAM